MSIKKKNRGQLRSQQDLGLKFDYFFLTYYVTFGKSVNFSEV